MNARRGKPKKPVAVDLFSGCGGLTLGLKRAGFRVSVAVENDSLACRTYRANQRSTALIEQDIQNVRGADIVEAAGGHVDLVAGCPPCQGFSTMRTKNGHVRVEDTSNELVFEFLRIVTEIQPTMVMLENVPALATDERIEQMVAQFEEEGLRCTLAVLNAQHFGVPQRRRRMILLASTHSCPGLAAPSGPDADCARGHRSFAQTLRKRRRTPQLLCQALAVGHGDYQTHTQGRGQPKRRAQEVHVDLPPRV